MLPFLCCFSMQAQWDWGGGTSETVVNKRTSDSTKVNLGETIVSTDYIEKSIPILYKLDSTQAFQLNEILKYLKWNTTNCEKTFSVSADFNNNKFLEILECPFSEFDTIRTFFMQIFKKMKVRTSKGLARDSLKDFENPTGKYYIWFSSFLNNNYPETKRYIVYVNPEAKETVTRKIAALFPDTCGGFGYYRKIHLEYLKNGKAVFVDSNYLGDIERKIAKIIAQDFYWDSAEIINSNNVQNIIFPIKSKEVLDNQKLQLYPISQLSSDNFNPPNHKNNFKLNIKCIDYHIINVEQVQNWRNPSGKSDVIDSMYFTNPSEFPKPIEISVKANKYYSVFLDKNTRLEFMLQKIKVRKKWKYYITTFHKDNLGYTPIIYSKNIAFFHISGYKEYQFEMAIE